MVLSRPQQRVSKDYSELGINTRAFLQNLVDLSKGKPSVREGEWFYRLFAFRQGGQPIYGLPNDIYGVREALRNAWWIEEEDIRSEMSLIIIRYQFTTSDLLRLLLTRNIMRWLIQQRLFSRQTNWEIDYQNYEEERRISIDDTILNLNFIFENTIVNEENIYWRYLIYLHYVLGCSKTKIANLINLSRKQVIRNVAFVNKRIKERRRY